MYKILNLHVENVKRVEVVDITPEPDMVVIAGKNAQGKSSILDSIEMLFMGSDAVPGKPVRDGQEKGNIVADLGDLIVRRTFTEKGSYLFVENKDGSRHTKPQEILDRFVGRMSFDPLEFTRLKPRDQYEVLKGIAGLGKELEEAEAAITAAETERTEVNREAARRNAALQAMGIPEPAEKVDTAKTLAELTAVRAARTAAKAKLDNLEGLARERDQAEQAVELARRALTVAENTLTDAIRAQEQAAEDWEKTKPTVPTKEKVAELEQAIAGADAKNEKHRRHEAYIGAKNEAEIHNNTAKRCETTVITARKKKADLIAAAKFPVTGLSIADGTVLYKEIPFNQASGAEQIRVSTAIAMASNPKLRVIRIKDASVIDDDGMAVLKNMAKEHGFQIWAEVVRSDDPCAVVIEEGKVKAQKKRA